jgi:hypothetical protein
MRGLLLVLLLLAPATPAQAPAAPLEAADLRCEYLRDPVGVDVPRPRLSWTVVVAGPATRGRRQTAWHVRAANRRDALTMAPDCWDSGWVDGDRTLQLAFGGPPLRSRQDVFWQVRVRDEAGREGPWSAPATFTAGVVEPAEWTAQWIGASAERLPPTRLGYHAAVTKDVHEEKWVGVDLGSARPIDRVVLVPVFDHFGHPEFGFPVRFLVEAADEPTFASPRVLLDASSADFDLRALAAPRELVVPGGGAPARCLRVRATSLMRARNDTACLAIAELEVWSGGENVARQAQVLSKDAVEHSGWSTEALADGVRSLHDDCSLWLRKEFTPAADVVRAVVHVCGLGHYVLTIDGTKVGDDWLTPGWTQYGKTALYDTFDVTAALAGAPAPHCLALHLGGGMYDMHGDTRGGQQTNTNGPLQAILELHLDYADGRHEVVGTDANWQRHEAAETYCGVFGGEDYDARREPDGWKHPGFPATGWLPALEMPGPGGRLCGLSRAAPPVRVHERREPQVQSEPRPGVLVLDLGQNASWVPEVDLNGPAGARVSLWPAEILRADGTIDQVTMRPGKHATVTLRGGPLTWHPAFWYCGSRYWQVEAAAADGSRLRAQDLLRSFRGLLVHTTSTPVGTFTCSNELFVRTRELIEWALRSNMVSLISDCPHREKSGWLEQIHLMAPGMAFTFDMMPLFGKTMSDVRDAQLQDGMVPTTAPEYFVYEGGFRHSIEWGGACFQLPRLIRDWYGDTLFLGEYWPVMQRYLAFLQAKAPDGLLGGGLGDWDGGFNKLTPIPLTGTAYYHLGIATGARIALDLGRTGDAAALCALGEQVRAKFCSTWLDPKTGKVAGGSQASQAIALDLDLVPRAAREAVFARLVDAVAASGYAIDCGEIGHPSLLRALADGGRSDLVFAIHSQSDRPGYGWHLTHGATALTETWNCGPISHNHFMLGHILEWFYRDVAGLRPDPEHPAFAAFTVRPTVVGDLTWAKARYDSIRGRIETGWQLDGGALRVDVVVPPNTAAVIELPGNDPATVREGAGPAANAEGVVPLGVRGDRSTFRVGSGRYAFTVPAPWR